MNKGEEIGLIVVLVALIICVVLNFKYPPDHDDFMGPFT